MGNSLFGSGLSFSKTTHNIIVFQLNYQIIS